MAAYDVNIGFDTGNAAFADGNGPAEVAAILRNIAARVEQNGEDAGVIRDSNGNKVGSWSVELPEPEDR